MRTQFSQQCQHLCFLSLHNPKQVTVDFRYYGTHSRNIYRSVCYNVHCSFSIRLENYLVYKVIIIENVFNCKGNLVYSLFLIYLNCYCFCVKYKYVYLQFSWVCSQSVIQLVWNFPVRESGISDTVIIKTQHCILFWSSSVHFIFHFWSVRTIFIMYRLVVWSDNSNASI